MTFVPLALLLAAQGATKERPRVDWDAVTRRFVSLGPSSSPDKLLSLKPKGAEFVFAQKPSRVAHLPGGWLLWVEAKYGSDHDGARILLWRDAGGQHAQVIQKEAFHGDFGYGDGVLFGPATFLHSQLFVCGVLRGMSPFGYGGIEVWSLHRGVWKRDIERGSSTEISDEPEFIKGGPDVRMTLRTLPEALSVPHGGDNHLSTEAFYRYKGGKYLATLIPTDIPLRAADELVDAVAKGSKRKGLFRTSETIWKSAQSLLEGSWRPFGERDIKDATLLTLQSTEKASVGVELTIRKRNGHYQVVGIKKRTIEKGA